MFKILKSQRLLLRKLNESDQVPLFQYLSNKENFIHVNMPVYESLDQVKDYMNRMAKGMEENKWILWAIDWQGKLIGTISLWNFNEENQTAEFGYGLFPKFRKQGFMSEAISLCETYAFEELHLKQVEAYTSITNPDSNKLLNSLNYKLEKTIEEDGDQLNVYIKQKK
jgi:ribosomal-protein-alanine N-acetyltransferase